MKKLFVDLDDTYKDIERYLRQVVKANGLACPKKGTIYQLSNDIMYKGLFDMVFSSYSLIPNKEGVEENLSILETEYEVIFCSAYISESEKKAKREFADSLGKEIILCGGELQDKSHVNMQGESFIDDRGDILALSNASKKIQMYNPYTVESVLYVPNTTLVLDWYMALDELVEVNVDEELRRYFCRGV